MYENSWVHLHLKTYLKPDTKSSLLFEKCIFLLSLEGWGKYDLAKYLYYYAFHIPLLYLKIMEIMKIMENQS